ncbi:MAG: CRISPR-associated exonuclease Cas4/endonuclease Cas1 fusion [Actinomycetota bacterium]|nr:MAG: CRISPR-associated exonuclease Cas4/endonuclease Cas1 fusion [Actinomycetota bacterium]
MTQEELPLVPARMVNEFSYCPRLFYLEWIYGEWAENADTLEGSRVHARVEVESGRLPPAEDLAPEDRFVARGLLLASERLGLVARTDIVEAEDGKVRPVDYKKGKPGPRGPWEPERVQLCVQGLLLREHGYQVDEGILYYAGSRSRVVVPFDEPLVSRTLELVREARAVAVQETPPPPLNDSPKCPSCVLVGVCLPDEVTLLRGGRTEEVRRLVPARDDAAPVYVQEQGAVIGRSGERLVVRPPGRDEIGVRLLDVSQLSVYGNVQVTAQAMRALIEREIPILHHTYGGWLVGVTTGPMRRNVLLRVEQYRLADDAARSLGLARSFVVGKLRNQRTLVRRNHPEKPAALLRELARLARLAQDSADPQRLLGIEGLASRVYFTRFAEMLKEPMGFNSVGRLRRPPPDPVNALLSFVYSLLVKEGVRALLAAGLDPYRGVYHQMRVARPSLALDLIEEFRPLIGDSVVLQLVNNRIVRRADFVIRGPACSLTSQGRRKVVRAFESRMDVLVRHPLFGYQVSYRRVMEMQARLLARVFAGELSEYRPFVTR